jgi:hypothetical protein
MEQRLSVRERAVVRTREGVSVGGTASEGDCLNVTVGGEFGLNVGLLVHDFAHYG